MEFKQYCDYVAKAVEKALNETGSYSVEAKPVIKNNGYELMGLTILDNDKVGAEGRHISPCIYLEEYYNDYQHAPTTGTVMYQADKIIKLYQDECENRIHGSLGNMVDELLDWELTKEKVLPQLVNLEWNKEDLKGIPHVQMGDFAVVYRVILDRGTSDVASCKVNDGVLARWGITEEELHAQALKNMKAAKDFVALDMEDTMVSLFGGSDETINILETDDMMEGDLYVLSNRDKTYGPNIILDQDVMKDISKRMGGDFVIIPSSIHELLAVKVHDDVSMEDVMNYETMIREVNCTQVEPSKRLSDNPYYYDSKAGEVKRLDAYVKEQELEAEAEQEEKQEDVAESAARTR